MEYYNKMNKLGLQIYLPTHVCLALLRPSSYISESTMFYFDPLLTDFGVRKAAAT